MLYDLAVRYGAPRDALMQQRQQFIRATLERTESREEPSSYDCAICRTPENE